RLSGLRMIAVTGTEYDQIDIASCLERGIVVSNLRGWCDFSVSEHVFAFALALRRNLSEQGRITSDAIWHHSAAGSLHCTRPARDLCGDTMGITGFGRIGKRVAGLAKAFGMKALASEHKGNSRLRSDRVEFSQILRQGDIISLHCPLTHETHHLIGEVELRSMKRDAILINCARGGLVDHAAL